MRVVTRESVLAGDLALVLSSLVDHRREAAWADQARAQGTRLGFVGLAASKLPDLFLDHSDLDALPLPRWDLLGALGPRSSWGSWTRPLGGLPVLASRSCPEFCTYCPHRILTAYRARSVGSILEELEMRCRLRGMN